MPGVIERVWRGSVAACGTAGLGLALLSMPAIAPAQDARASTRITEADCRNRAKTDEEVVVCGRRNVEDPYRVPKALRKSGQGTRTAAARAVDAMGSGVPGTASNIGAMGMVGHAKSEYDQWRAEQAEAKKAKPR